MSNNHEIKQTVYISFNNDDPHVSSFISYLDAALYREGIDVVLDKTGHELEKDRFTDIKLFLVVFSNLYASSVACLENLVKLLEFLQQKDHVIVPVFYDAKVKQPMEVFGDKFAVLEKSHSADQVTKWRRVLEETMKLQGHEYSDELRDESKFIEDIAKDVFDKLHPTERIGIQKPLTELENLQCKQAWGFRSIGIVGKPGIGKTTLAKAAFRRMSDCYDDASRIIPCNDKIIELLTDEDFQEIPMEKFDLNNQDAKRCLRLKRVLLVLDDVRNAQDVESFLCGFKRFGPGSLLIITSRDRKVLEECRLNEIYELKGLSDEDSLKLFTRCLFGKDVIDEKLRKASARAIERFHGNPSALRLFAEKIKMKGTRRMESALGRICHVPFIYTKMNILFFGFQGTTNSFSTTFKQSFLLTTSHYQTDFEKLQRLDLANRFFVFTFSDLKAPYLYHDSVKQRFFCATSHNYLFDLKDLWRLNFPSRAVDESLPVDLRILHLGQKYVLVCQLNKPWEGYKSFSILMIIKLRHLKKLVRVEEISKAHDIKRIDLQDCTSLKSTPITDQLEPLQVLNLSGCIESQTLQTETLCLLCNSATKSKSHLYFDCTFCLSIWTAISNRIHISPLQLWEDVMVNFKESKAKKILSRMVWCSTICGLLAERNRRLYRQSYRSVDAILVQIDKNFRSRASRLRKKHPRIASKILQLWLGTSSSHLSCL